MAQLQNHGEELHRYFSLKYRALVSVRADGVNLYRTPWHGWKVLSRRKKDLSLDEWKRRKGAMLATLQPWQSQVKNLPSVAELESWAFDSVCDSVTGDTVEPDGHGSDGAPSWLLAFGLI